MGTVGPVQTLIWPNSCMYLLPKSTAMKARLVSIVRILTSIQVFLIYRIYQAYLRDFVKLYRKISIALPKSHCPCG